MNDEERNKQGRHILGMIAQYEDEPDDVKAHILRNKAMEQAGRYYQGLDLVEAFSSMSNAIAEAGGALSAKRLCEMTLADFLIHVAGPNGVRFKYMYEGRIVSGTKPEIKPPSHDAMTLEELDICVQEMKATSPLDARVLIDTEAQSFGVHVVGLGAVEELPEEVMGEDLIILHIKHIHDYDKHED